MKIGVKTYDSEEYIQRFTNEVDFIEVIGIAKYEFLKNKNVTIHCKHERFGVNIADKTKEKENILAIQLAIDIADFCGSKRIIVHPGFIENENCTIENSIKLLKKFNDKRIIIENLPFFIREKICLCSTPENTKFFLEKCDCSFCFDINHAISSALFKNLPPYSFLEDFQKLNPAQIHLGGQTLANDKTHLNFTESDIDLKKVLTYLPKNSEIILEVTQDINETEKDIAILRKVLNEIGS
jgi:endonuclease IV